MRTLGAVLIAACTAVVLCCGGSDSTGVPSSGDGGSSGASGGVGGGEGGTNPPACPAAQPTISSACTTEGLHCEYTSGCRTAKADCTGGTWHISGLNGDPPAPVCPETVPKNGDACNACTAPTTACSYPCTGGATSPTTATCTGGAWQVLSTEIACPVCNPTCTDGKICCSEPTHMAGDGGGPGSAFMCVPPQNDGSCPLYP